MNIIREISKYFVGGLFIFSGLIKINDPVGTAIKLEEYFEVFVSDFGSFFHIFIPYALPIGVIMVVLEVVLGVAVLVNYRAVISNWILLLLIIFFTFLTFYSAFFGVVQDCGCFGDAIKLTPWQSFYKDVILLVLVGVLFISRKSFTPILKGKTGDITMGIVTLAFIYVAIHAINHLPFIDFRAYKIGANIEASMSPSEELKYVYVMEKDGETVELENYPTDPSYIFKEMVLTNPEAQPTITDYSVWNDDGDFTAQSFQGTKIFVIIYNSDKASTSNMDDIKSLIKDLGNYDIDIWALTASGYDQFEAFRHKNQLPLSFYYADATVLKTMVRSNPGIMLVRNGTVLGKWHHKDTPSAEEIRALL